MSFPLVFFTSVIMYIIVSNNMIFAGDNARLTPELTLIAYPSLFRSYLKFVATVFTEPMRAALDYSVSSGRWHKNW